MNALITYDITIRHTEAKSAMQAKGYFDYWTANNQNYYLPNTSLWKAEHYPTGRTSRYATSHPDAEL